ncbi:MAG: CobD/CbiB family protein [Pseudomonadota bacterium]
MTFLSILCVLVLEQFKASPAVGIQSWLNAIAARLERRFNGGERRHGRAAWMAAVVLPVLAVLVVQIVLERLHPLLALAFDVAVLYLVVGFRQFSHYFTDIHMALRMGEIERARQLLTEWRGRAAERLGSTQIARLAIEQGIVSSHRHVFAPLFWFMVFGPAGAVLYRLALGMWQAWADACGPGEDGRSGEFGCFAGQAFQALDWLPARLTATTFAVVGDFEDAVFCWRTQARQWGDEATGILLASGAGALGIRLGQPLPDVAGDIEARPEMGLGDDVDVEHLQSAVGLVWRALVLCLLLLALLTLANWVGG